jgi:hypothetical protein
MTRSLMRAVLMAALAFGLAGQAMGEDIWDPPWDMSLPNQTVQAWEFAGPYPGAPFEPTIDGNPYGFPYIESQNVTWPDIVEGPDGVQIETLHVDSPGGLTIWVPNNPDPLAVKKIFWQVTSDKSPSPQGTGPTATAPDGTTSTSSPSPYPQIQHSGTWYTYNGLLELRPNPDGEWITFPFLESTNIEEIVIKTICVPEPATLSLLAIGGLLLVRRKRR